MLRASPELDTIVFKFDELESAPLTIDLGRPITITAAPRYRPTIVFRPGSEPFDERGVIDVDDRLTMNNVSIRAELPYGPVSNWALFRLEQTKGITLTGCVLTLLNDYGSPAAFFDVSGPEGDSALSGAQANDVTYPSITLQSCIARGQATLVRATSGHLFQLDWKDGLLATTERLADVGPLAEVSSGSQRVLLLLRQVTVIADRGLCRLSFRDMEGAVPHLDIETHSCVIVHQRQRPLVEHIGAGDAARVERLLLHQGARSIYPHTATYWQVVDQDGSVVAEHDWEARADLPGYQELSADVHVDWQSGSFTAPHPAYTANPAEYQLEDQLLRIGFTDLPEVMDAAAADDAP